MRKLTLPFLDDLERKLPYHFAIVLDPVEHVLRFHALPVLVEVVLLISPDLEQLLLACDVGDVLMRESWAEVLAVLTRIAAFRRAFMLVIALGGQLRIGLALAPVELSDLNIV